MFGEESHPESTPAAGLGRELSDAARDFSARLRAEVGTGLEAGHSLELVENGRVFDEMERLIARARSTVHLAQYIWRPGKASDRVLAALFERARAGVVCRVLIDSVGSRGRFKPELLARLKTGGCQARLFHPLIWPSLRTLTMRNHRKLLIVDGEEALTGGWCIWDKWLGDGRSPDHWRDTNIRVRGPAVAHMQMAFEHTWITAGGTWLSPRDYAAGPADRQGILAAFVPSDGRREAAGERLAHAFIAAARQRLWIASGYFVPDDRIVEALGARARAGVDVRVLVPGPFHDLPLIRVGQRSSYPDLLERGVRIWEYQPSMMHAKAFVADGWLSIVGSLNIDPQSLNTLAEGSIVSASPELGAALERSFLADLEHSQEITSAGSPRSAYSWSTRVVRNALYGLGRALR
ncbi:MAG: phospholipase D-like domain-containing protein [Myxococcales bacterium]